jgi:hypothetical protein
MEFPLSPNKNMPEINIKETTVIKDQVFFPGKAVLSDKAAEVFKQPSGDAVNAVTEPPKAGKAYEPDTAKKK